jgi:hypothetical protein
MPAIVWVVGALVVIVGALLAVDWFTAGRVKGRMLVRARDGSESDSNVNYTHIEQTTQGMQHCGNP